MPIESTLNSVMTCRRKKSRGI